MRDELTDSQIALLCDIEESDLTKFDGDRKRDLGGFSQRVTLSRRTAILDRPLSSPRKALIFSASAAQG